jgi:hypothetical protein
MSDYINGFRHDLTRVALYWSTVVGAGVANCFAMQVERLVARYERKAESLRGEGRLSEAAELESAVRKLATDAVAAARRAGRVEAVAA